MMRRAAIVSEAVRNVDTGMTRGVLLFAVLMAVSLGSMAIDLIQVRHLQDRAERFRSSGANVLVLSSTRGVDPRRCESLADAPDVLAAGALAERESIYPAATPGSATAGFDSSPGFGGVLQPQGDGGGILISKDVATTLGLQAGDRFTTTDGAGRLGGVFEYPQDGRRSGFGYATIIPTADRRVFAECWVRAWPLRKDLRQRMRVVIGPPSNKTDDNTQVSQLNGTLGEGLDVEGEFRHRFTAWLPLLGLLVGGLVCGFVWHLRRLELAQARHSGVSSAENTAIAVLEMLIVAVPAAAVGVVVTAVVAQRLFPGPDAAPMFLLGLTHVGGVALGAVVGAALRAGTVGERHLLSSFRER